MKKLIIALFFLGLINSCNNLNHSFKNKIDNYKTKSLEMPFDSFIDIDSIILPDFKNILIIYPGALKNEEHSGIQLLCEYDSLNFNKMKNLVRKKTIRQLSFSDTSDYHMIDWKNKYNYSDLDRKLPFPELDENFSKFKEKIDLNHSTIYFVSYGEGIYIKPEVIAEDHRLERYLQTGVHGYSNGAVIDSLNQRILYWIMIF